MLWAAVGAAAWMLGVVAGAFGAHGLASQLDARSLQTFETAVRYHLIHGLGLLAVGALVARDLGSTASLAGALMAAGIVLFSGSLYWLALGGPSWLGPVTPLGGLCLIAAWGCLFVAVVRQL